MEGRDLAAGGVSPYRKPSNTAEWSSPTADRSGPRFVNSDRVGSHELAHTAEIAKVS